MKIAHFAPYAPHACGMYEAARDFVHSDVLAGNDSIFVDVGAVSGGVRNPARPGEKDARNGFTLTAQSYADALDVDVLVLHDGVADNFLAQVQAPVVLVIHGRPSECFRPEYKGRGGNAYSFVANISRWPRVKRIVTMWPRYKQYWLPVSNGKLTIVAPPPIDETQFNQDGAVHLIPSNKRGTFNLLIADSWREVDPYEILHGVFEAAPLIPGLKLHFYAVEQQSDKTLGIWEHLFAHMRTLGIEGEVFTRVPNMGDIYRSMDAVLTPHNIVTRIIGEALCCGTPVISGTPCEYSQWQCFPDDPDSVSAVIVQASKEHSLVAVKDSVKNIAKSFQLKRFGEAMKAVYEEAVK